MSLNAPLSGVHIVEFEGLGPGPLAGWMLAGMGARITLIARPAGRTSAPDALQGRDGDLLREGKTVVELDLKASDGRDAALALIAQADALIEAATGRDGASRPRAGRLCPPQSEARTLDG